MRNVGLLSRNAFMVSVAVGGFFAMTCAADTWNVRDFGAKGDGRTLDTAALQKALDACAGKGGGVVCVPKGTYLTGTIYLGDDTELHLEKDAVLLGSPNLGDYNADDAYPQNFGSKYEGWSAKHLILALEKKNVSLTGEGVVDGNAKAFFAEKPSFYLDISWRDGAIHAKDYEHQGRPGQEIVFVECSNVRVEGVTLRNMCCWNCFLWGCDDVVVKGITIRNNLRHLNTDGVDIDSCRNVFVSDCDIETGDDAFAVRGNPARLRNKARICENVTISNCVTRCSADGVRVGIGAGRIRNVRVYGLDVRRAGVGLEIHTSYFRGEDAVNVENVRFENIRIRNCASAIACVAGNETVDADLRNISWVNVDAEAEGPDPFIVEGNGRTTPVNLSFSNVRLRIVPPTGRAARTCAFPSDAKTRVAMKVRKAKDVTFDGFDLSWRATALPYWGKGLDRTGTTGFSASPDCRFPDPTPANACKPFPARGICAHGGDQKDCPENSVPGLLSAVRKGAAMVELDVQRCRTGEFICMHDGNLATTTTVTGNTWQSSFAHIRSGTVNTPNAARFGALKVPTFDEMIDSLPTEGVFVNVHCYGDAWIARDLAVRLRDKGRLHQAYLATTIECAKRARAAVPDVMICNMTRPGPGDREWTEAENWEYLRATLENGFQALQLRRRWSPKFSAWAHMAGLKVGYCPYDCEGSDPERLGDILATGVDYVFTENLSAVQRRYGELTAANRTPALTLAERGRPAEYEIIVPQAATKSVENGARHLRDYILRQTGVELKVRHDTGDLPAKAILLGYTRHTDGVLGRPLDRADLGTDGFRIVNRAPHLVIAGSDVRGALYGAYEALERFGGVRWFAGDCTDVPNRSRIEVPADYDDMQVPFFEVREPSWMGVRWNADLGSHLRHNGPLSGYTNECDPPRAEHGGAAYPFSLRYGICHTFWRFLNPDELFDSHPEYFSEVEGRRKKDLTQLCLSNPDVLRLVTEKAIAELDAHPEVKTIGVSQNDWWNFCTCPKCKAIDDEEGSHCGSLLRFVNAVAEAVERKHPDAFVQTLAYEYTRKPPKRTRPRRNVLVCLCDIESDFSQPYRVNSRPENAGFEKDIEEWSRITDHLSIWNYSSNYRHSMHPMPNCHVLLPNLRFFRECNATRIFVEGGRWHEDMAELKAYLIGKGSWNPYRDYDALVAEFLDGYYGKASAPFVRKYLEAATACVTDNPKASNTLFMNDSKTTFPDAFVAEARKLWEDAVAAAKDDPVRRRRCEWGKVIPVTLQLDRTCEDAKYVWATRHPEKVRVPADAAADRAWVLKLVEDEKALGREVWFGSYGSTLADWAKLPTFKRPGEGSDSAIARPEDMLVISTTRADLAKDADALGGTCVRINNKTEEIAIWFQLSHLAFDADAEYRVRVHAKVDAVPGGKGEAFRAEAGNLTVTVNAEDAGTGYRWYELGTGRLDPRMIVEIFPGRFAKGGGPGAYTSVSVDGIEFSRAGGSR